MKVHVKVALIFPQRFYHISLVWEAETKTVATSYCILRSVSVCILSFFPLVYAKNAEKRMSVVVCIFVLGLQLFSTYFCGFLWFSLWHSIVLSFPLSGRGTTAHILLACTASKIRPLKNTSFWAVAFVNIFCCD